MSKFKVGDLVEKINDVGSVPPGTRFLVVEVHGDKPGFPASLRYVIGDKRALYGVWFDSLKMVAKGPNWKVKPISVKSYIPKRRLTLDSIYDVVKDGGAYCVADIKELLIEAGYKL